MELFANGALCLLLRLSAVAQNLLAQGCNQLFISGGGNFHELSFDDVIVLIQP